MLKVETKQQETIDPKDLTDKHFIGVVNNEGLKGHVVKLSGDEYTIVFIGKDANSFRCKIKYISIEDTIIGYADKFKCEIYATLDYEEFKKWYFNS